VSERLGTLLVVAALVVAGGLAWWLELRSPLAPTPASLGRIPLGIGSFEGSDLPVGATVESILKADYHLQRVYEHVHGDLVWVYVGYYGTNKGGTPEHPPRVCYTAHGWEILDTRAVPRSVDGGDDATEYLVELEGQRRLVLYWYRSFRAYNLRSIFELRVDHVIGQLTEGRADGALVRLSTPISDGDRIAARNRLLHFAAMLEGELETAWPEERRGS
jgi:EpsI family protein